MLNDNFEGPLPSPFPPSRRQGRSKMTPQITAIPLPLNSLRLRVTTEIVEGLEFWALTDELFKHGYFPDERRLLNNKFSEIFVRRAQLHVCSVLGE